MAKSNILIFIDWFYPAFKAGGPIKSVFNLIANLHDSYDFSIITSAYDLDGEGLEVLKDQWIQKDGFKIIYLTREEQTRKNYKSLALSVKPDLVYYNSLFSKNFTIKPLITFKKNNSFRQMIAPRGMLGVGALSLKPTKKKIFLKLAKSLLYDSNLYWHATSPEEFSELASFLGKDSKIKIAANLASPLSKEIKQKSKEVEKLNMFFLSRISPKKNLFFLLELLQHLKDLDGLVLDIYGPIEDEAYWQKCKKLIDIDSRVYFKGEIKPQDIQGMIGEYHLFCLPTLNENYGHVIAESLSNARPILISDQTPWHKLKEKGIGEDIPLKQTEEWKKAIRAWYQLDQAEFDLYTQNCFRFAQNNIVNSELIQQSELLFQMNE